MTEPNQPWPPFPSPRRGMNDDLQSLKEDIRRSVKEQLTSLTGRLPDDDPPPKKGGPVVLRLRDDAKDTEPVRVVDNRSVYSRNLDATIRAAKLREENDRRWNKRMEQERHDRHAVRADEMSSGCPIGRQLMRLPDGRLVPIAGMLVR